MARRGASEDRREAAALRAGRRAIARGERPVYRLAAADDDAWRVDGATWLSVTAAGRRNALAEGRRIIAAWLDVTPDTFDVEISEADVSTITPPKADGQVFGG
jgi:hypothetical protein